MDYMEYSVKIFNLAQADKFIKCNCTPIGCALGDKQKAYVEFLVDKIFLDCMEKWQNRKLI